MELEDEVGSLWDEDCVDEGFLAHLLDSVEGEMAQALNPLGDEEGVAPAHAGVDAPGSGPPSSSAEPVVPAVPPPPGLARIVGVVGRGAATVILADGRITYYDTKNAFEATCCHPDHGKCVLTRTARGIANTRGRAHAGGRPLGYLAAWLRSASSFDNKAGHWSHAALRPSVEARRAARREIATAVGGQDLLSYERPVRPEEQSEPEDLHGLV